jgi:sugar phosphate permease
MGTTIPEPSPDGPGDAPASQVRYLVLLAGCTVAVVVYIHRVGFASALPYLKSDLHLNAADASWLTALFLVAYGGFEIPCGMLGDRLGIRHLLTLLVLGWSITTGLVALVVVLPNRWMLPFLFLLVIRFLFGMFQAGAFPSLSRMMTDWMPMRQRASAQGLIWMSTRAGGMVIPLLLGGLIWVFGNWQTPLWVLAGLGLLWCAVFWPWFRNRPEEMPQVNAAERRLIAAGRENIPAGHANIPWGKIFRCRSVWFLCLLYGFGGFAANFYVTLLPTYLKDHRHLPDRQIDWLTSLPFACGLVACISGGLLSDGIIRRTGNRKWGRRLNGLVGMLIGGTGWLLLPLVRETWALALVLCLIFFCNDLGMGPAWASCADVGERYAGTIGGAMNMIGNITGALGNLLAGYLFDEEQTTLVFIIYGASFWLASACWLGVNVTRPVEPVPPTPLALAGPGADWPLK